MINSILSIMFGTFKKLASISKNRTTSHARPFVNGLSGIHYFYYDGFPPKTCGNDYDWYWD